MVVKYQNPLAQGNNMQTVIVDTQHLIPANDA